MEEQFYLLFPAIVALLPMRILRRFLIACVAAALLLRTGITLVIPQGALACYVLMPCRMDELALGGLVAIMMRSGEPRFSPAVFLRAALGGGTAVAVMFASVSRSAHDPFVRSAGYLLIGVTCAAALAFIVSSPLGRVCRVLRWKPLVYTGQISYGLYILHGPAAWVARALISRLLPVEPHTTLAVPLTFAAGFLAAGASWRWFESKLLKLKDRFV